MKDDKRLIVSFILNALVFLLVLAGTIVMVVVKSEELSESSLAAFKYFTFQSNIFMGIIALIYGYYQFLQIKGKIEKIPQNLGIFNLIATSAVALTFIIVVIFLAPGYGYDKMYKNANLFFHGIVPVVAIINYLVFTRSERYRFPLTLLSIIPSFLYGLVYFIVVASLNGYGNLKIDFYLFGKDGPFIGALYYLAVMAIAYSLSLILFFGNRLVFKKSK